MQTAIMLTAGRTTPLALPPSARGGDAAAGLRPTGKPVVLRRAHGIQKRRLLTVTASQGSSLAGTSFKDPAFTRPAPVAFAVPDCQLQPGEHLRMVGSCAQLGLWDVAAAPQLSWHEGDTWRAEVALPPGQHTFKLAIIRQDGTAHWEEGPDRILDVPEPATAALSSAVAAAAAGPVMRVVCRFWETGSTVSEAVPDSVQFQAAAEAATARVRELLTKKRQWQQGAAAVQRQDAQQQAAVKPVAVAAEAPAAAAQAPAAAVQWPAAAPVIGATKQQQEAKEQQPAAGAVYSSFATVEAGEVAALEELAEAASAAPHTSFDAPTAAVVAALEELADMIEAKAGPAKAPAPSTPVAFKAEPAAKAESQAAAVAVHEQPVVADVPANGTAAVAAVPAQPEKPAADSSSPAPLPVASADGTVSFSFGPASDGSTQQSSASEMAQERLAKQLPAETAAALARQLGRMSAGTSFTSS